MKAVLLLLCSLIASNALAASDAVVTRVRADIDALYPAARQPLHRPAPEPRALAARGEDRREARRAHAQARLRGDDRTSAVTASSACSRTARARRSWSAPTWTRCRSSRRRACRTPARCTTHDDAGREVPVMHACGHDMHMTTLDRHRPHPRASPRTAWNGTLVFIGQPAEETASGGAKMMLDDGLFKTFPQARLRPRPARSTPTRRRARSASCPATCMANVGRRRHHRPRPRRPRRVSAHDHRPDRDRGAHRARAADDRQPRDQPARAGRGHRRLDPRRHQAQHHPRRSEAAAHRALVQARGARAADRGDRAHRQGGSRGRARAEGATGEGGREHQGRPTTILRSPSEWEGPACCVGRRQCPAAAAEMGAEDFSEFVGAGVPGVYLWVGAVAPAKIEAAKAGGPPLPTTHSSLFAPDREPTLRTAVLAETLAALELINGK